MNLLLIFAVFIFVAQLTDTHCRILVESHYDGQTKRIYTFLDSDEFLPNWGFGEDNYGNKNFMSFGFSSHSILIIDLLE